MADTRKAIPGEKEYQQPGYFIVDGIITYRCPVCFQHMSLLQYSVKSNGKVDQDVVCNNCNSVHSNVTLTDFDSTKKKDVGDTRVKNN